MANDHNLDGVELARKKEARNAISNLKMIERDDVSLYDYILGQSAEPTSEASVSEAASEPKESTAFFEKEYGEIPN